MNQASRSFAEVTLLEAVARKVRVELNCRGVASRRPLRLSSQMLGLDDQDRLLLEEPRAGAHKVFLPPGWELGMAFSVGEYFVQVRSSVLDHCQHLLEPQRRVEAMVVQRPGQILALNRRQHERTELDASCQVTAHIWPFDELLSGNRLGARTGRLRNISLAGLGIELSDEPGWPRGQEVLISLSEPAWPQDRLFRACFRHCSQAGRGAFLAGFGDVLEWGPGQSVRMIDRLARL
jgi:hypothetical protein